MSFSGGVYTLPGPALVTGEVVSATENNQFRNDVAGAFNLTFLRNGTSTATANLPMGGYKLTGLGVATTSGDALSYGQAAVISDLTASGTVTISSGTANGVAYLNGSKVLTTGSALTFDGTNLAIGTTSPVSGAGYGTLTLNGSSGGQLAFTEAGVSNKFIYSDTTNLHYRNNNTGAQIWYTSGSEQMRLTSTGLGIGTSSPATKLQLSSSGNTELNIGSVAATPALTLTSGGSGIQPIIAFQSGAGNALRFGTVTAPALTGYSNLMTLDSSGNLGLGVAPSAWSAYKVLQISGNNAVYANGNDELGFVQNAYYNGGWKYGTTGVAATWNYQYQGKTVWNTAPSGTAGNAISFTQAMTLDASGNLGIGTSSPSSYAKLAVIGGGIYANPTAADSGLQVIGDASSVNQRFDVQISRNGGAYTYARINLSGQDVFSIGGNLSSYVNDFSLNNVYGGSILFKQYATERMRIDSSGNVGINTTSPGGKLGIAVGGSSRKFIFSESNGYPCVYLRESDNTTPTSWLMDATQHIWLSNATERMRIDSSGNLLVGTTSAAPGSGNTNKGCAFDGSLGIVYGSRNSDASGVFNTNTDGTLMRWHRSGSLVGSITVTTTTTAYNTSSDYRLKENIQPMQNALDVVQQLNPVTYTWKADGSDGQGFIAHELQAVVPGCVTGEKDAVDEEGNPVYQGIDTSFLVATLTKAIQELKAELDATKAEVAALKGN